MRTVRQFTTTALILFGCLICGMIVAGHTVFHKTYGVQSCQMAYGLISCLAFVMAFVALFRKGEK
jgi:hypothetical protein